MAGAPSERAEIASAAMLPGKDVMMDKPGMITAPQLATVREVQAETGESDAQVEADGIGRVAQTVGWGRLNCATSARPGSRARAPAAS